MTVADVQARLGSSALHASTASGWDDEAAHGAEDALREDILQAIADGTAENPAEMARLVLTLKELPFARWMA